MKKFLILILTLLTFSVAGCGDSQEKNSAEKTVEPEKISAENKSADEKISDKKILIAYFSRADENYNVGTIEKGNTEIVAEIIESATHADMFEIKPVKAYPANYQECTEIAKTEQQENARPEIIGKVENFADYDVIFLGYPIWWGDLPMAVYTFLESYDFTGKKIVPFCTHEGSGLGGTEKNIADTTKAEVLQGLAIKGTVAHNDKDKAISEVDNWLKTLDF